MLHHGESRAGSSDVSLFKSIRTRHAEFKRALLVVDAGALIRKANRVAVVQYGNDRLAELRVYEVFHKFADDHEREVTALFLHGAMDGVGHIFQVRTYIRLFDYDTRGVDNMSSYTEIRVVYADCDRSVAPVEAPLRLASCIGAAPVRWVLSGAGSPESTNG